MSDRFLDLAIRAARCSKARMRVGAILTQRHRTISFGFNKGSKTHPKSPNVWKSIHAELDALLGVPQGDLAGAEIYVVRLTKTGKLATSRPCTDCRSLLVTAGIRRASYVNSDRQMVTENL